jgi:transcriptional regulator with XRE-family HTH domain
MAAGVSHPGVRCVQRVTPSVRNVTLAGMGVSVAQVKPGSRADRESLRVAMLAQGCGVDEIAAEMRAQWGYALRAAYRHANGLTLDQAAERCNVVANDADARTSGSRVSDWEGWPSSGRRPSAFNLIVLAKSYGTLPRRLISPDEWEALDERERLILTELGHSHEEQKSSAAARVDQAIGHTTYRTTTTVLKCLFRDNRGFVTVNDAPACPLPQ